MSGRTKIRLPWQTKVASDVDLNEVSLTNLTMPEDKAVPQSTSPNDVINRQYVAGIVGGGGAAVIGPSEDGTYDDGLFQDFEIDTEVGTVVDRFNELFKALAPSPAPALDNIGIQDSGVTGKLSFGSSNAIAGYTNHPTADVGDSFGSAGDEAGIFATGTTINGNIANNVAQGGASDRPYPAKAFGDGDQGDLHLEVNGSVIHTTDLTSHGSGGSTNGNGSGFVLSAAASIEFDSGEPLELFKYRTGTWTVDPSDQRNGFNQVRIRHEYSTGLYRDTNVYEWVVDDDTTATTFSGEGLANENMAGARDISGVTYHTSGTVEYDITISNAYRNTHSQSSSGLNYAGTNAAPADTGLPTTVNETADIVVGAKVVSINNSNRLLNDDVTVGVTVDRTVQSDLTSSGETLSGFLVDNITDNASNTSEPFNGEGYRMHTGLDMENTNYDSGSSQSDYDWDASQHLMSGDADHNTGLLISGGKLSYPSNTSHITNITGGNFQSATLGPGGNPNYSTASGNRTYIRYFYSPLSYSNFRLNLSVTNTTFVTTATGVSGNNLTLEILAPDTTVDTSDVVEWKDAVEPHNANDKDIGCFASTFGDTIPTNWGLTIGTQNTSTSGNVILVRITAASAWSGSIESMSITWL